jgi:hypothetical protein
MSDQDILKEETTKVKTPKLSSEFALPQCATETLIKIVKGYAVASNGGETPIKYMDVASAAGISPTYVSSSNRFLAESQILISPKYGFYLPSEGAIRFARESAWDEAGAKSHLRKIVAGCWYGQVAIQNFTLRPNLTQEDFKRALAIKCGASEGDAKALDFLIDFIIYTGLVDKNDDGTLTRGNFDEIERPLGQPPLLNGGGKPVLSSLPRQLVQPIQPPSASLVIHLHIKNFEDLTPENATRLKEWLKSINDSDNPTEVKINTEDQ